MPWTSPLLCCFRAYGVRSAGTPAPSPRWTEHAGGGTCGGNRINRVASNHPSGTMRTEQIAAVLLAAGTSSRFGEEDKLMAEWRGKKIGSASRRGREGEYE